MTAAITKKRKKPSPEEPPSVDDRTTAARERVRELRSDRVKAALSGERFDHAALRDAEDELAALQDAAGELVRQARAKVAEAEADRVRRLRAEIGALATERGEAIEEAEALARGMVDALLRAEEARTQIASRFAAIEVRPPMRLDGVEQATRLSRGLSAVLGKLSRNGTGGRWGELILRPGFMQPDDAWLAGDVNLNEALRQEAEKDNAKEA